MQDSTALIGPYRLDSIVLVMKEEGSERELIVARLTFHRSDMFQTVGTSILSVRPGGKRSLWASDHTIVMDGPELNVYVAVKQAVQGSVTSWEYMFRPHQHHQEICMSSSRLVRRVFKYTNPQTYIHSAHVVSTMLSVGRSILFYE